MSCNRGKSHADRNQSLLCKMVKRRLSGLPQHADVSKSCCCIAFMNQMKIKTEGLSQLLLSRGSAHSWRCQHNAHLLPWVQGRAELLGPNSPLQSRSIFGCSWHWQLSWGTHIALNKGAALEGKQEWKCTAATSLWGQTILWPGLQRHCSAPVKPEGPGLGQHSQTSPSSERSSYCPAAKNPLLVRSIHYHLPFPPGLPTLNKKK